jgi:large-conductance mechanosensitive channel
MSNIIKTFNFIQFAKFLNNNNVVSTAIAAVLSERISDIMSVFVDNIIMPIINIDCNNDGVKDIKNLEDYEINVLNINFKIGKLIISLIKFFIVMYIIYIISNIIGYDD